jgi:hypothetical protein
VLDDRPHELDCTLQLESADHRAVCMGAKQASEVGGAVRHPLQVGFAPPMRAGSSPRTCYCGCMETYLRSKFGSTIMDRFLQRASGCHSRSAHGLEPSLLASVRQTKGMLGPASHLA